MQRDLILLVLIPFLMVFPLFWSHISIVEGDLLIFFEQLYRLPWKEGWNPDISGGVPRFVNPQLATFYPPAWPFAWGFHRYLPWYFVLHSILAGVGTWLWLRENKRSQRYVRRLIT